MSSPEYQGQANHLGDEYPSDDNYDDYTQEEGPEEEANNTDPINVFLGTLTSTKGRQIQEISLNAVDNHPDKIYANVKVNEHHSICLKVDTGADTCIITTTDLQLFLFPITILPCKNVLRGYGGSEIENIGAPTLRVSFKCCTAITKGKTPVPVCSPQLSPVGRG